MMIILWIAVIVIGIVGFVIAYVINCLLHSDNETQK